MGERNKNTPHPPLRVDRALKTRFVFYWSKIPVMQVLCHRRNKVSASRPYAPDTRGVCFQGPSRVLWYFKHPAGGGSMPPHSTGMKSEVSLTKAKLLVRSVHFCSEPECHPLPQFRTAALRSNRQRGDSRLSDSSVTVTPFRPKARKKNYLYSSTRRVRCS